MNHFPFIKKINNCKILGNLIIKPMKITWGRKSVVFAAVPCKSELTYFWTYVIRPKKSMLDEVENRFIIRRFFKSLAFLSCISGVAKAAIWYFFKCLNKPRKCTIKINNFRMMNYKQRTHLNKGIFFSLIQIHYCYIHFWSFETRKGLLIPIFNKF